MIIFFAKKIVEVNVANVTEILVLHVMLDLILSTENVNLMIVPINVNSVLKEHTSRLQQEI